MNPPSVLEVPASELLLHSQGSLMLDGSEKHTDILFLAHTITWPATLLRQTPLSTLQGPRFSVLNERFG